MVPRSDVPGHPASEGVLTSLPFVPTGAAPDAVGPLGELRGGRDGPRAAAELYAAHPGVRAHLREAPLRNDRPGAGPLAIFLEQTIDISPWFNAERPRHSSSIQVQLRQHTTNAGSGYFTLVGDMRTGP